MSRPDVKQLNATIVDTGDAGDGSWEAVASDPYIVDRDDERIAPFAFNPLPTSIPTHDGHNFDRIVGRCVPRYDARGVLHVSGKFSGIGPAQRVRQLVREGVLDSMSVAFHRAKRELAQDNVTTITSGELLACDFVSVGSNPNALVTSARGFSSWWNEDDPRRAQLAAYRAQLDLLRLDLETLPRPSRRGSDAKAATSATSSPT